jgi:hypothetical protein
MDVETKLYECLAKTKEAGTYDFISPLAEQSINLYMKRFGDKEYAQSIPEEEFTEQLLDCVEHIVSSDENAKKLFESLESEEDQSLIIAVISGLMIG